MAHALSENLLPGMDSDRLKRLADAGLSSLEDVVAAGPTRLAQLTSFDLKTCRALIRAARSAMDRTGSEVIELMPMDEPASMRLTRGLTAARNIERAASLVRKAKAHTGKRAPRDAWSDAHTKARRQLRKLLERLQELQQSVLSDGLSHAGHEHLSAAIDRLELELEPLLQEPIRKRSLKRLRRAARNTRQGLLS